MENSFCMKSYLCGVFRQFWIFVILGSTSMRALAQFVPNMTDDRPLSIKAQQSAEFEAAIAAYVAKARKSYPAAKMRFLRGLPPGQTFFVTVQLRDNKGASERVFVRVAEIHGSILSGSLANEVLLLDGFEVGESIAVDESSILDWLIASPDGSEEGNLVGKFLDTYRPDGADR